MAKYSCEHHYCCGSLTPYTLQNRRLDGQSLARTPSATSWTTPLVDDSHIRLGIGKSVGIAYSRGARCGPPSSDAFYEGVVREIEFSRSVNNQAPRRATQALLRRQRVGQAS